MRVIFVAWKNTKNFLTALHPRITDLLVKHSRERFLAMDNILRLFCIKTRVQQTRFGVTSSNKTFFQPQTLQPDRVKCLIIKDSEEKSNVELTQALCDQAFARELLGYSTLSPLQKYVSECFIDEMTWVWWLKRSFQRSTMLPPCLAPLGYYCKQNSPSICHCAVAKFLVEDFCF